MRRVNTASVNEPSSVASALSLRIAAAIRDAGGWLPFERFMAMALYEPGLGYYANTSRKFGLLPQQGSDFVTAPELSPLFGRTLARQVAQALSATGTDEVWEFGAGSGALALQLIEGLAELGQPLARYRIVDLSGALRERQQSTLAAHADRVQWLDALPEHMAGVVVGNEVLDAMPVSLIARVDGRWLERGVALDGQRFAWADRPTDRRPPTEVPGTHDYLTELQPQAEAFVRTLGDRLQRGAAFFVDYGFPEAEFFHPQRSMGTLVAHRAHRRSDDVLAAPGEQDITAHVNFTGIALAAQDAGLDVIGYTSQGRFLLNAGLIDLARNADLRDNAQMQKLILEHEMGELFKVIALAPRASSAGWVPIGFAEGDRTHRL
ncbi:MAG: SAM-dependent methyltransferase [Hydrogenophaga sp.]|uniref:class I SAM-dependent methyltransferase n=1 Tax=Hydrogenophaga sp. TaxID=1904254 RepID=UPI001D5DE499|nr:SAM-dependent methyltransferase [Hydrogenophaga sp.]MBX3611145.1 SAM-dependent methyltransferase [Hydrogenophaga sp.]